jgi:hypothetical protein
VTGLLSPSDDIIKSTKLPRAPLEESRKWGIYYVINLLFKTYFKLNSASLSKNMLKALTAGRTDMPELSAFPKSQQVTFKYYEGVLHFLEENYVEVSPPRTRFEKALANRASGREAPHDSIESLPQRCDA